MVLVVVECSLERVCAAATRLATLATCLATLATRLDTLERKIRYQHVAGMVSAYVRHCFVVFPVNLGR